MTALPTITEHATSTAGDDPYHEFDLHVRGEIPRALEGSLVVAASRRHKDHSRFARWHDSQADLMRLDFYPGKPGKIRVRVLSPDPTGADMNCRNSFGYYSTQPNHGINIEGNRVWATNLLFGAPLEVDLVSWRPRRILRYVEPSATAPHVSGTSHFAWSLDRRYAYFHQSLLESDGPEHFVRSSELTLVELDTRSHQERTWRIVAPASDADPETANFHSGFYFEEAGERYVGLLRTGARLESLQALAGTNDREIVPMPPSAIWLLKLDHSVETLTATTLPGLDGCRHIALSHLAVGDASDGFVLYANYKHADISEYTHGTNVYGEEPQRVGELYSGMIVEALNHGAVIRYEWRGGKGTLRTFSRPYDPDATSLGHSWLPINLETDPSGDHLFCSFSGFRPRLLSRHIAGAYTVGAVVDPARTRFVPSLLMRMDATTLEPDRDARRSHLSYTEPIAMTVVGDRDRSYVCTFSPELGVRIYPSDDLGWMLCHAIGPELMSSGETHFRPDPAHVQFASR